MEIPLSQIRCHEYMCNTLVTNSLCLPSVAQQPTVSAGRPGNVFQQAVA
jgi:hypothetical protein